MNSTLGVIIGLVFAMLATFRCIHVDRNHGDDTEAAFFGGLALGSLVVLFIFVFFVNGILP